MAVFSVLERLSSIKPLFINNLVWFPGKSSHVPPNSPPSILIGRKIFWLFYLIPCRISFFLRYQNIRIGCFVFEQGGLACAKFLRIATNLHPSNFEMHLNFY